MVKGSVTIDCLEEKFRNEYLLEETQQKSNHGKTSKPLYYSRAGHGDAPGKHDGSKIKRWPGKTLQNHVTRHFWRESAPDQLSLKLLTGQDIWDEEYRQSDVVLCAIHSQAGEKPLDFGVSCLRE